VGNSGDVWRWHYCHRKQGWAHVVGYGVLASKVNTCGVGDGVHDWVVQLERLAAGHDREDGSA